MCYCSDVSAYNAAVIFRALRKKRNTNRYIGFAHCIKEKGDKSDGDTLGKKPRAKYEVRFTQRCTTPGPVHTRDYFLR